MLNIQLRRNSHLHRALVEQKPDFAIDTKSPAEKVRLLIVRDLLRLGWEMTLSASRVVIKPPDHYDKQIVRDSMQIKRQESLLQHAAWISSHIELARHNLADGPSVWNSNIEPVIESCKTQEQHDVFRIFRFYWSSPYSDYVGRRVKLLVRDNALPGKPLIGIAALGSSIVHIPARDSWIGWDKDTRTKNLIYTMDAYVLGALPPYNHLLGGKLMSYIVASNEVRDVFRRKYRGKVTNICGRTANRLACIFTTSLYGRSAQYNRLRYDGDLLYIPVGHTRGYGTLHLTNETFEAMRKLLKSRDVSVNNRFGDGPVWRMRVIRTAADILGFDADFLLKHSFRRAVYAVPLAHNFRAFLNGTHTRLRHRNLPLADLIAHWRERWLNRRKRNADIKSAVLKFRAEHFNIV